MSRQAVRRVPRSCRGKPSSRAACPPTAATHRPVSSRFCSYRYNTPPQVSTGGEPGKPVRSTSLLGQRGAVSDAGGAPGLDATQRDGTARDPRLPPWHTRGNQEGEPSGDVRGGSKRGTAFCGWAAYPLFRAPFSTGDWSDIRSGRGGGRRSWAQLREAAGRSGVGVAVRRRGPGVGDALHGVGLPRAARGLRRGEVARVWSFGIGETVVRRDVHRGRVWSEQALATADDAHPRRQLRHRGPTQLPEGLIAESHGQGSWQ